MSNKIEYSVMGIAEYNNNKSAHCVVSEHHCIEEAKEYWHDAFINGTMLIAVKNSEEDRINLEQHNLMVMLLK